MLEVQFAIFFPPKGAYPIIPLYMGHQLTKSKFTFFKSIKSWAIKNGVRMYDYAFVLSQEPF